jgi:hypothetical protein
MIERSASFEVADDFRLALTGKSDLLGIYPGDIVIPIDGVMVAQLIIFWTIRTDANDPFKSLSLEVNFPAGTPLTYEIPLPHSIPILEGRTFFTLRQPQLVQAISLRQGRITGRVIHERGEIVVKGPWITSATPS